MQRSLSDPDDINQQLPHRVNQNLSHLLFVIRVRSRTQCRRKSWTRSAFCIIAKARIFD